jgi:hypothetical protein
VTLKMWCLVLAVALSLSVGFTAGYMVRGPSEAPPASTDQPIGVVSVPSVLGLAREEALSVLEATGLDIGIQLRSDPAAPRGVVVQQDPPPGVRVPQGTQITIVVSGY